MKTHVQDKSLLVLPNTPWTAWSKGNEKSHFIDRAPGVPEPSQSLWGWEGQIPQVCSGSPRRLSDPAPLPSSSRRENIHVILYAWWDCGKWCYGQTLDFQEVSPSDNREVDELQIPGRCVSKTSQSDPVDTWLFCFLYIGLEQFHSSFLAPKVISP